MINYWIEIQKNNKRTIKLYCPKCGRIGKLIKYKRKFIVRHIRGGCVFGWTNSWYDMLSEIYKKIRGDKNERSV